LGYKLGRNYKKLPKSFVRAFSMNKEYWAENV
jgi:rhamnosyltransferase